MNQTRFSRILTLLLNCLLAILTVAVTTVPLYLIGRNTLGEAVIALLYLVPVVWSANRWGQWPGIIAALAAALTFDFLFIPPFYTFAVAELEGWLVLAIFLGVAVVVVVWIQASLTRAREAVYMYQMSEAICGQRNPEGVAYAIARRIQQLFQANLVNVIFRPDKEQPGIVASEPRDGSANGRPDRVLSIVNSWGLVGEIQIWRGLYSELPSEESRLFQNFALQAARAFERTYTPANGKPTPVMSSGNTPKQ